MNPSADKFPAVELNPAGPIAQNGELGMNFNTPDVSPSREVDLVPPSQDMVSAVQAGLAGPAFPQTNPIVPPSSQVVTPTANMSTEESDEELEKKWVSIAKSIVERTKTDPHLQRQELSKAGKEYREKIG